MDANKSNEVYISFDVKDSLVSSFISYLITAFNRQGISPFFAGKSSDVEAAERESEEERFSNLKVFVVVLSENYASHVPRLEKEIYSCRHYDDFVVVPIFYHVSISSVKEYVENSGDSLKAVQASLPKLRRCHEYDGKKSESKFQEDIARDVFEILYPTEEIGIQSPILDIQNLLCKQPWGVRTIGICGVCGIGKTTLAKAVVRQMSCGYDDSCFIKDFQAEYNEKKIKYLPNKYLSDVEMEKFDLNCSDSEPRRRKKRVLTALDDVRNFKDAKSFLGRLDNFSPGSLIIITSRDRKVLVQCQMNEIYELKGLNHDDARKLFTRCAFGKDVIEENLLSHSIEAIKSCKGNPSALRLYAKREATLAREHHVPYDVPKIKNRRIIPYEEDDEQQENKEPPSDQYAVLAAKDTIIRTSLIKRDDEWFYGLNYYSIKSLLRHLRRNDRHVLHQRIANQLQKNLQSFSNTGDLDQRELLLNLGDGAIEVVPKEIRSRLGLSN